MTKDDILHTLSQQKNYLQSTFKVDKIGLFGSFAKETQNPQSDIDFYVEFGQKSFNNLAGLWVYLEELYHTKVDIIYKHKNNNPLIINNIQKEVLYG